jgi:hypothetical protein
MANGMQQRLELKRHGNQVLLPAHNATGAQVACLSSGY